MPFPILERYRAKRNLNRGRILLGFGLFLLSLTGCDAGYYWHLARGQARVVLDCEPVADLLARADLDSTQRTRLLLIGAIRRYGMEQIGLEESSSYTCLFDTQGEPVSWNVSASLPDRFTPYLWSFPIAGTVPYKGFFDKERAQTEYDRLKSLGYDTILRPVSAYSTLGYFSDPVLSTMLEYHAASLADLILHELTHGTVYVQGNTDFNESLATFVGRTGSLTFLADHFGADTPLIEQAQQRREDATLFQKFMAGVVTSLDSLYSLELPRETVLARRQDVFQLAKERYRIMRSQFRQVNYDGFLKWEINNARLLSYRRYHRNLDSFAEIYSLKKESLNESLQLCKACESADDPWNCLEDSISTLRRSP